jgi:hypothetical protein
MEDISYKTETLKEADSLVARAGERCAGILAILEGEG